MHCILYAFCHIISEKAVSIKFFLFPFQNIPCEYSLEVPFHPSKTYVVGTHYKRLAKVLLMRFHNVCIYGEIRKNIKTYVLKRTPYIEL